MNELNPAVIEGMVQEGLTHEEISRRLTANLGQHRGFSERSVRRFCERNSISSRSCVSEVELNRMVFEAVQEVGPVHGRKTIKGYLLSRGLRVSSRRIAESLRVVTPGYHRLRQTRTARQTNPIPYTAEYFGLKLHADQNEKLVMYGVTHYAAVDGYSGMIVSLITMSIKNSITIYESLFEPILWNIGIWDTVRVDHGLETSLLLHVQDMLSDFRTNTQRRSVIQSPSTKNHIVERIWVEVNGRVNYPIKLALNEMSDADEIDMMNPVHMYAVSEVSKKVAAHGCQLMVSLWNNHTIPGKGIPNEIALSNKQTGIVPFAAIPTVEEAVTDFETQGGTLTRQSTFGHDPLEQYPEQHSRRGFFFEQRFPSVKVIYGSVVNGDSSAFKAAVKFYITLTNAL